MRDIVPVTFVFNLKPSPCFFSNRWVVFLQCVRGQCSSDNGHMMSCDVM